MIGQRATYTIRCFSLVLLSLLFLPFSFLATCLTFLGYNDTSYGKARKETQSTLRDEKRRTVLVTGVGMAKGITLARAFYLSGHRVIGADFETFGIPCSGRYSKSLSAFHPIPKPNPKEGSEIYIHRLVELIKAEGVELWVSCSGVASAIEDAQAKESIEQHTRCKCIQFDVPTTSALHEKNSFIRECKSRALPVPETHNIESKDEAIRILSDHATSNPGEKFILKPIGVDDLNRANMTLLPLSSELKTKAYVSRLSISASSPWILQQFIPGGEEYCTHALIVRGDVKCFVACPSAEFLMHYKALPRNCALWRAMYAFTADFVERSPRPEAMTGHLSFDFMACDGALQETGFGRNFYAIECNPRAHTAVVLFGQQGPKMEDMVQAYLSAIVVDGETSPSTLTSALPNGIGPSLVMPPVDIEPRYWIGHDIVSLFVQPALRWSVGSIDSNHFLKDFTALITHFLTWKEGTFETWDPIPALALYHIYWPMAIMSAWWHGRSWSRINVSTTKMFAC
ncbi:hypothetical protein F4779DRAFT_609461 [Xylariaceae sp. FL0662B]|nr:hypothetical protein F4779DRAFT_609461 [Xylariaceae sp. FL0662B]